LQGCPAACSQRNQQQPFLPPPRPSSPLPAAAQQRALGPLVIQPLQCVPNTGQRLRGGRQK
jgi:hypothetical protein